MTDTIPPENALVLYRGRPARVLHVGEKLEIELGGGETQRVRPKDVALLHRGPLRTLADLRPQTGEVETAWEILAGSIVPLHELAELAFGVFTPATAWATWQLAIEGLYFRPAGGPAGEPDEGLLAATGDEVGQRWAARVAEVAERIAWDAFVGHARAGSFAPEDVRYLREIEALAYGVSDRSRSLRELNRAEPHLSGEETPENAHALLLALGYWDEKINPHPRRAGLTLTAPNLPVPPLPDEPRRDLTHLVAYAIDDASTDTPDDALSDDGERLWVHVADPAAIITPGSPLDLEARARGTTLYLPEGPVPMLPPAATPLLGLGLTDVSPALSFGIRLAPDGNVADLEVTPSWVRVTRLTYEEAAARLDTEPLRSMYRRAQACEARRRAAGAVVLEMPEAMVRVQEGVVSIRPVPALPSRTVVENAMVLAGEAVARFAIAHGIALPFATQEAPDTDERPVHGAPLSAMFAFRRKLTRSQYRSTPGEHAGLGLDAYVQTTSPMRRYLDLVVHQQLRAYLAGQPLLSEAEILERLGTVEAILPALRTAERHSEQHWTLVYLRQHEGWRGDGVLADKRGLQGMVSLAEIGWEASVHLSSDLPLDSRVTLTCKSVDLARLDARWRAGGG